MPVVVLYFQLQSHTYVERNAVSMTMLAWSMNRTRAQFSESLFKEGIALVLRTMIRTAVIVPPATIQVFEKVSPVLDL